MIDKNYLPDRDLWECIVPAGIKYLSDWKDFDFAEFPFKCVIDKQIPGCGYTEWVINNSYNVILASPRKMLLENKSEQHPGEVFLVRNELDRDPGIDKDLNRLDDKRIKPDGKIKAKEKEEESIEEKLGFLTPDTYNRLRSEFLKYLATRGNQPIKVLVTYDSYYIMKAILEELGIFSTFFTVVDEYQSVLIDSRFKSTTEFEFMEVLKAVQYVHFVSATPMLEKYTKMLDDFKDLPMFTLNWDKAEPNRVVKPNLKVLIMKSVGSVLPGIIQEYLDGKFKSILVPNLNGTMREVVSREAVFYVNSVNHIVSAIKRCSLRPDQVNILCARTPWNEKRIKDKLGVSFTIGSIPTKGQPHKMFTFCTRTVYLGADFYSTNARTFVLSDANIETLTVDISLDLPQIMGRQRLESNPWKDEAEFYYRSVLDKNIVSQEDFNNHVTSKMKKTEDLFNIYKDCAESMRDTLMETYEIAAKASNYRENYVSIDDVFIDSDHIIKVPTLNKYVLVAEQRAFDLQQTDYADRFTIFSSINDSRLSVENNEEIEKFFETFDLIRPMKDRLIYFIDYKCSDEVKQAIYNQISDKRFHDYVDGLGESGMKACGFNTTKMNEKLGIIYFDEDALAVEVAIVFHEGDRASLLDLTEKLKAVYDKVGYKKVPKATQLSQWFDLKAIKLKISDKWVNGYELKKKEGS